MGQLNASASSYKPLDFFESGLIGLPVCIVGGMYLALVAPLLLMPETKKKTKKKEELDVGEKHREGKEALLSSHFGSYSESEDGEDDDDEDKGDDESAEILARFDLFTSCVSMDDPALVGSTLKDSGLMELSPTLHVQRVVAVIKHVIKHDEKNDGSDMNETMNETKGDNYRRRQGRVRVESHTKSSMLSEHHEKDEHDENDERDENDEISSLPETILQLGDILVCTGSLEDLTTTLYRHPSLMPVEGKHVEKIKASFHRRKLVVGK
jgi:hypothetical protein